MEFVRLEKLIGSDLQHLHKSHVMIFGIGGVGGFVVEALARSGVGQLTLVDHDTIALSNINRQLIALVDNVGQLKVEAYQQRIKQINPLCVVNTLPMFVLPENLETISFDGVDMVVDAIDTVAAKLAIVMLCKARNIPVVSVMGAGNKLDPTGFVVSDIHKTHGCPLAKVMRLELRKRGIKDVTVVYSPLPVMTPQEIGNSPTRRSTPGSYVPVVGMCGLLTADVVMKKLMKQESETQHG